MAFDADPADNKTLVLSSPEVTREKLEALVRYQRALSAGTSPIHPSLRKGPPWEKALARAHTEALKESGLEPGELGRLSALCADFCAKRLTAKRLRAKRAAFVDQPAEAERLKELDTALARLEPLSALEARHGKAAIALFAEREQELLALHEELWPAP